MGIQKSGGRRFAPSALREDSAADTAPVLPSFLIVHRGSEIRNTEYGVPNTEQAI